MLTGHGFGNLLSPMKQNPASFRALFDPNRYTNRVLALILEKSEEWHCSPLEAELRLLDELAASNLEKDEEAA